MQSHLLPLGHPNQLELPLQFVHLARFDHSALLGHPVEFDHVAQFDHPAQSDPRVQAEILEHQDLRMRPGLFDNLRKIVKEMHSANIPVLCPK